MLKELAKRGVPTILCLFGCLMTFLSFFEVTDFSKLAISGTSTINTVSLTSGIAMAAIAVILWLFERRRSDSDATEASKAVEAKTSIGDSSLSNEDLLMLEEIADRSYNQGNNGTTIRLVTWIMKFKPDDHELYRMRARAYKRLGPAYYEKEINDRKHVARIHPDRHVNHVPIVENYILLKRYHEAAAWIRDNRNAVSVDQDVRTMFHFYDVVCRILQDKDHKALANELRDHASDCPLSEHFVKKFWKPQYLIDFINQSDLADSAKGEIQELIRLLRRI